MLSTIFSGVAVVISIIVAIVEYVRDVKLSRVSLESEYFKDIYKEHLVYKIPNARKYVKFDATNKLKDTDNLIDELQDLCQDSLYFQYNNHSFYKELKAAVQKLEDYLVHNTDKEFVGEEQTQVYNYIKECIDEIYRIISGGYLGKKRNKKHKRLSIKWE